jgi:preprotein translocase subunit SecB
VGSCLDMTQSFLGFTQLFQSGIIHCALQVLTQDHFFNELKQAAIHRIEQLLNHHPRKCCGYRTPDEVFPKARGALDG